MSPTPTQPPAAITTGVYVIQNPATPGNGSGEILQFSKTATGNVNPTGTITAPTNTAFIYLATDGTGNVYSSAGDIREYTAGATGSATPIRSLPMNATTKLGAVQGLYTSESGEIFVSEDSGGVASFSAMANGSVAPTRYILGASQTGGGLSGLISSNNVVADSADNLYVVNEGNGAYGIGVFGSTATGNVAPTRTFGGFANGLAIDSAGNVYGTDAGVIKIYGPAASGNDAPIREITGALTKLGHLGGIRLDSAGSIYVVSTDATGKNPTVLKFASGADGNVAPVSSFTSSAWTNPDFGLSIAVY